MTDKKEPNYSYISYYQYSYEKLTREKLAHICGMPKGVHLHQGVPRDDKGKGPWGSYTRYVNPFGKVCHCDPLCDDCGPIVADNVVNTNGLYRPCRRCRPKKVDTSWYETYQKILDYLTDCGVFPE